MHYFDKNALKLSHVHFKAHIKEGDTGFEEHDAILSYLQKLDFMLKR